jgi:hypothetical protein
MDDAVSRGLTDISAPLHAAASTRQGWGANEVWEALAAFRSASDGRKIDWDDDAGEQWGRVLANNGVVALVSAQLALTILRSDVAAPSTGAAAAAVSITVADFDAIELRADRGVLVTAFPDIADVMSGDKALIDPDGFSAQDLWYATV